jgi:hypothetical protein
MTEERQPREREGLNREPKPELGKETLKDLDLEEQSEEVKGGTTGGAGGKTQYQ